MSLPINYRTRPLEDGSEAIDGCSMGVQGAAGPGAAGVRKAAGGGGGARRRCLLLVAAACGAALLQLSLHRGGDLLATGSAPRSLPRHHAFDPPRAFTIDTAGCTIPALKPFDETIKKFILHPTVELCRNSNFTLLHNNRTHIWINKEHVHDPDNISCCYRSFFRPGFVDDVNSPNVDQRVEYRTCIYFSNHIKIVDEFVKVTCEYETPNRELSVYEQFFITAQKKHIMQRRLIEDVTKPTEPGYNVVIMGLDAISRMNFYRTMPKTEIYLKNKGAVELMGYNKVGDNTFPNLTPLLVGVSDIELQKTCWPHAQATFDNCPFVWEWFKDVGYYTALAEDNAKLGTFNFERNGFVGTPTDYYAHTFMHEAEKHSGNNMDVNSFLCMGNKYFYQVLLDYVAQLAWTLRSSKLFGFFWEVTMSHDYLNHPSLMDESYETFLKYLDSFNYLDNTVLIFVSDHGMRWGEIRYTKQGRLEERLPLAYILTPPSFRKIYKRAFANLQRNSRRLTTPFDLHATLVDLVTMDSLKDEAIEERSRGRYSDDRSISLFLPVPGNRTCKLAGIDDHWCTCHRGMKAAVDSDEVREAGEYIIGHLNHLLREHKQCSRLRLEAVLEATELVVGEQGDEEVGWREFVLAVRAVPGGGVFEATLRHDARGWSLAGSVSRLNLYGTQSRCVHHYLLKLYCYCQ